MLVYPFFIMKGRRVRLQVLTMAENILKLKDLSIKDGNVHAEISFRRIEKNCNRAQFALDSAVMTSMVKFMPLQSGVFIHVTRAMSAALSGTGRVCAAAPPMGRFLYEGNAMVDEETGSAWAKPNHRKVLSGKKLQYSTHANPDVTAHWFDAAKNADLKSWIQQAQNAMRGNE